MYLVHNGFTNKKNILKTRIHNELLINCLEPKNNCCNNFFKFTNRGYIPIAYEYCWLLKNFNN